MTALVRLTRTARSRTARSCEDDDDASSRNPFDIAFVGNANGP